MVAPARSRRGKSDSGDEDEEGTRPTGAAAQSTPRDKKQDSLRTGGSWLSSQAPLKTVCVVLAIPVVLGVLYMASTEGLAYRETFCTEVLCEAAGNTVPDTLGGGILYACPLDTTLCNLKMKGRTETVPVLHAAACQDHHEFVEALLRYGAKADLSYQGGLNAIDKAAFCGSIASTDTLLRVSKENNSTSDTINVVMNLVSVKANGTQEEDTLAKKRAEVLYEASDRNLTHLLTGLLDADVPPDAMLPNGQTALHVATRNGNVLIVKSLLERGAQSNFQDVKGQASLHYAANADADNTEVIEMLLDHNANPDVQDKEGRLAQQIAYEHGNGAAFTLLLNYQRRISPDAPKDGRAPPSKIKAAAKGAAK